MIITEEFINDYAVLLRRHNMATANIESNESSINVLYTEVYITDELINSCETIEYIVKIVQELQLPTIKRAIEERRNDNIGAE